MTQEAQEMETLNRMLDSWFEDSKGSVQDIDIYWFMMTIHSDLEIQISILKGNGLSTAQAESILL